MPGTVLSQIHVYPIKSAGGVALDSATVDRCGLRYDRRWMLVDDKGVYITQRRFPRMALIDVEVSSGSLTIEAPAMSTLRVPVSPEAGGLIRVRIWDDLLEVVPVCKEADHWFSEFLGIPCRLVYMPDDTVRLAGPEYATGEDQVAFADRFPFLLTSEASLDDLNTRLAQSLPMNRFRPNLVIKGCEPYAEDEWKQISIGHIPFRVAKPCSRCAITTVEQTEGAMGREPLHTLAKYRRFGNEVLFGQNLIHNTPGTLRVGDPLEVTALKKR